MTLKHSRKWWQHGDGSIMEALAASQWHGSNGGSIMETLSSCRLQRHSSHGSDGLGTAV